MHGIVANQLWFDKHTRERPVAMLSSRLYPLLAQESLNVAPNIDLLELWGGMLKHILPTEAVSVVPGVVRLDFPKEYKTNAEVVTVFPGISRLALPTEISGGVWAVTLVPNIAKLDPSQTTYMLGTESCLTVFPAISELSLI